MSEFRFSEEDHGGKNRRRFLGLFNVGEGEEQEDEDRQEKGHFGKLIGGWIAMVVFAG